MSRPNTRNKNKRPRADESESATVAVFKKIHTTGDITKSDVRQLYMMWKPICHGCHGNSKDSPNCFCGLIPAANGVRKAGLWQKTQDIVRSFGPDPSEDIRDSTERPAGLTNLGATCYANSILQCLYMNKSFRSCILSLEPDILKKHPVLDQLARLFALLHSSIMAFIDSAPFIKTLELDNAVQQDCHEFLILLLSLLEQPLSHSKVPGARTTVQDLFRGSVSHVTRCLSCGKDSAASSKTEDFYELELNIKGLNNLEESLVDYFREEALDGDNQYFCQSCQKMVDATRCVKLRSLPPVVNFQLKRYVFRPKTTTKKKNSSPFSFPGRLDLGKWLSSPSSSFTYDLAAILIHKGTAANSGHYVAHIKDESNGEWWEFDDETVCKLGSHPFGEKTGKSSNKDDLKSQGISTDTVPNMNNNSHQESVSTSPVGEMFSSTDAYMLMFKRISKDESATESNSTSAINNDPLPHHLLNEINEVNSSYVKSSEEYRSKKDSHLAYVTERRQEVKSVLIEAHANPEVDSYFWISTDWLRQWADNIDPPSAIDNGPIQCEHGKVPASKVTSMKRISGVAWQKLFSKYGGGPTLSSDDSCMECLMVGAKNVVSADVYRDRKASFKNLAEAALAGSCSDETIRAKKADDIVAFPSDCQQSEICSQEFSDVASVEGNLRAVKHKQRQNHEKLVYGRSSTIYPVPDRRTSKRSQRISSGSSISLKVSGSTAVYQSDVIMCGCTRNSSCKTQKCQCKVANVLCNKNCGCQRGSSGKCTNLKMPVARGSDEDKLNSSAQKRNKGLVKQCRDDVDRLQSYKETLQEYNQVLMNEKRQLQEQIELLKLKKEEKMSPAHETLETTSLRQEVVFLKSELEGQKQKNSILNKRVEYLENDRKKLLNEVSEATDDLMKHKRRLNDLEKICKKQLNTIIELKGNIRVVCRVRPTLSNESGAVTYPESGENMGRGIKLTHNALEYSFTFDKVFDQSASQEDVFVEISELVQSALDGYKVCIFAYGQTGSGKTHTMMGNSGQKGIIPRSLEQIFQAIQNIKEWKYNFKVSVLEIYNETIRDLLSTSRMDTQDGNSKYNIRHDACGNTHVSDLFLADVTSISGVSSLLMQAAQRRSVGRTEMNESSSRSHYVFTLRILGVKEGTDQQVQGVLNLIDLAGSERIENSGATGDRLKETQAINKSLTQLTRVFCAIANKDGHVPFRDSKLTFLLQPCFEGDSKTMMFVNLSPEPSSTGESLCSLRFAAGVSACQITPKTQRHAKNQAQRPSELQSPRTTVQPLKKRVHGWVPTTTVRPGR